LVLAPDFQAGTGIASTVSVPSLEVASNVVAGVVSSDPALRVINDRVVVINRFGFDNLTVLDRDGFTLIEQVSTGADTNPQDVAAFGNRLYVVAFDAPGVLVFDATDLGAGVIDTIDLSALDPDDGVPDCGSIAAVGNRLFVTCAILDRMSFSPRGPGQVAVIDPNLDTVIDSFELTYDNPFTFLVRSPTFGGDLLIATTPSFGDYSSGCIERIDTGAGPSSAGCVIEYSELGGYVSRVVDTGDGLLATVITCEAGDCFGNPTTAVLVPIDDTGAANAPLTGASMHPTDIAVCPTGHIAIADTDYADSPGIRVFDGATELTTEPLDIGLPPGFNNAMSCF
jgi:hypothetical protein